MVAPRSAEGRGAAVHISRRIAVHLNVQELERRGRVALVLTGLVGLFPLAEFLSRYTPDAAARRCATENAVVVEYLRPYVRNFGRDGSDPDALWPNDALGAKVELIEQDLCGEPAPCLQP